MEKKTLRSLIFCHYKNFKPHSNLKGGFMTLKKSLVVTTIIMTSSLPALIVVTLDVLKPPLRLLSYTLTSFCISLPRLLFLLAPPTSSTSATPPSSSRHQSGLSGTTTSSILPLLYLRASSSRYSPLYIPGGRAWWVWFSENNEQCINLHHSELTLMNAARAASRLRENKIIWTNWSVRQKLEIDEELRNSLFYIETQTDLQSSTSIRKEMTRKPVRL